MTFEHSDHGYSSPRLLPQQLGQSILQRLSSTANARLLTIGLPQQLLCIRQLPLHILVGGIRVHRFLQTHIALVRRSGYTRHPAHGAVSTAQTGMPLRHQLLLQPGLPGCRTPHARASGTLCCCCSLPGPPCAPALVDTQAAAVGACSSTRNALRMITGAQLRVSYSLPQSHHVHAKRTSTSCKCSQQAPGTTRQGH